MSPRPRKVSDEQVFAAAYRVMQRVGPGELTLAAIGAEAGVTAGALTQRFGSKRALLLALAGGAAAGAGDFLRELWKEHRSPLATIRAYAGCLAHLAASPAALARNLAYLQIDLTDEDFRRHLEVQARSTRAALHALLDSAVSEGELVPDTDTVRLARVVETALSGSLITWATYREGEVEAWLRRDVEAVLQPYLADGGERRKPVRRAGAAGGG